MKTKLDSIVYWLDPQPIAIPAAVRDAAGGTPSLPLRLTQGFGSGQAHVAETLARLTQGTLDVIIMPGSPDLLLGDPTAGEE